MSKEYQLIDCQTKGNVVRFYYGDINEQDYYGDDWNDPLEDAGKVYDRFIKGYQDQAFPFDAIVLTPTEASYHHYITKEDLKNKSFPCLVVKELSKDEYEWEYDFFKLCAAKDDDSIHKFYFGDIALEEKITLVK